MRITSYKIIIQQHTYENNLLSRVRHFSLRKVCAGLFRCHFKALVQSFIFLLCLGSLAFINE